MNRDAPTQDAEDYLNRRHLSLLDRMSPGSDGCGIGAFAVLHVSPEAFPALRKQPGPDACKSLSAGLLRQSDEQAVAAAAAVFHAIRNFSLEDESFAHWGVVGAPCLLGRTSAAAVLDKYTRLGPRGVSPLVSPYLSLHAVSAMISVALQSHGPNLGVGGGSGAVAEGLLAGLTLILEPSTPGVWVALTAWDPAPDSGSETGPAVCHAVALALMPNMDERTGLQLRYIADAPAAEVASPNVTSLARFLEGRSNIRDCGRWRCPINGGGAVELSVGAGSLAPHLQRTGEPI